MTDFLLATASLSGLLAYSTVGVALYKWRTRGSVSSHDLTGWEMVGLALAILAIYGSVLATLILTTHSAKHGESVETILWGVLGGAVALVGVFHAFADTPPEVLHVFRSALWPLVYPLSWLARGLVGTAVFAARGPLTAGNWLANLPMRPELRRAEAEEARAAREARITELEKELDL